MILDELTLVEYSCIVQLYDFKKGSQKMNFPPSLIDKIRASSRTMVRELGFMRTSLAGTNYSPSAVHALLEINSRGAMTAAKLRRVLGLEKSSVSRMVNKLVKAGELKDTTDKKDSRAKQLSLTAQGKRTVGEINSYGQMQVKTALQHLNPSQQLMVEQGLGAYAQALKACRQDEDENIPSGSLVDISTGYRPGVVGRVTEMHSAFYSKQSGFGSFFESQVASGLAEFASRLDEPCNNIWVATHNDRIIGSISIDGQDLGNNNAHLRWFIMDETWSGHGVGHRLIKKAITFCDQFGFKTTQLWTFQGLDAARHLYESFGFKLVDKKQGRQWGSTVTEQQFTRF